MNQATFFATISDTSPGLITDLLTRASDDSTSAATTSTGPTETPATSSNTVAGFTRLPMLRKPTLTMKESSAEDVARLGQR